MHCTGLGRQCQAVVKAHIHARWDSDVRHIGQIRHCAACPIDRVKPTARCAAHPGHRLKSADATHSVVVHYGVVCPRVAILNDVARIQLQRTGVSTQYILRVERLGDACQGVSALQPRDVDCAS